ncbi:hypothetical protein P4S68_11405 [Pseudoalteromonas sp. Hal099]
MKDGGKTTLHEDPVHNSGMRERRPRADDYGLPLVQLTHSEITPVKTAAGRCRFHAVDDHQTANAKSLVVIKYGKALEQLVAAV